MEMNPNRIAILQDRAQMLTKTREFFAKKEVAEVDCPVLSLAADIAVHIDLITVCDNQSEVYYMHPSPEFGMKRLLSEGLGDIYQLSHVFRDNECGPKHNPEFMMVEWYRLGFSFMEMINETLEYIRLFLGNIPHKIFSYYETFQIYAGFDYVNISIEELIAFINEKNIPLYDGIDIQNKDTLLTLILTSFIEPQIGHDELYVLAYYPGSQSALAQTLQKKNEKVAERFEVYYKNLELCNGYHELTDPIEQRCRFIEANHERMKLGKKSLPLDENFLNALEKGIPDCCGVAVGFDRLMMLRHGAENISEVFPFVLKQEI